MNPLYLRSCTKVFLVLFAAILLSSIQSCGKKSFDPLKEAIFLEAPKGDVKAEFCTLDPSQVEKKLKILFVLDNSGSNVQEAEGRPPTDPDRSRRYTSLIEWLGLRKPSAYEYYSLLEFSGASARFPEALNQNPDTSPFTNDKNFFKEVVTTQKNGGSIDLNSTPYKAAMTTIIETVRADAVRAKKEADKTGKIITSDYVIIFLSDGKPTDSNETEIVSMVEEQLMRLPFQPDYGPMISQITLNTGYYYIDVDLPDARSILEGMARAGKGEAYSFDRGKIDYDKLTDVFIKKVTTKITDIIVNNLNTQWDLSSKRLLNDVDGDFLPDSLEQTLGSNPLVRDSDINGVGDGIEYLIDLKARPCRDAKCDPKRANSFSGCYDANTKLVIDTDKDGLTDCEEKLLGTDEKEFDSNGDDLPDFLSIKYSIPATKEDDPNNPTPPAASVDSDFDGEFNLQEVKVNTPPLIDNNRMIGLKPYKYLITQTSYNGTTGVACYELEVTDMSFATNEDTIRIYLMENETSQTGRKFIRIVEKKALNKRVLFSPSDFKL